MPVDRAFSGLERDGLDVQTTPFGVKDSHRPANREGQPLTRGGIMSGTDKAKNKVEETKGKAKEAVGGATGDRALENQGKKDQAKGSLKQAGEKVKDAFKK